MNEARPSALVTGASRGIGEAVAERLAAEGHDLTISGRTTQALREVAERLTRTYGVAVATVSADMSAEEDVRRLAAAHRERFDRLDVLILNAGMGSIGAFSDFPVRRLDKLFVVNVRSAYVLAQELLPLLRAAGRLSDRGGRIVAVASTTGIVGEPLNSAYGATKAALISWCETVSAEEWVHGVSATAVCPGYVATDMTKGLADQVPVEQMLPVSDVVEMVTGLTRLSRRTVVPSVVLTRPGPHLWRA